MLPARDAGLKSCETEVLLKNKTRLKVAKAGQQQAFLAFQNILLTAGQEVSNDMAAYQSTLEKTSLRNNQIVNLQKAVEYTQLLSRWKTA
jgi:outer membrane protein TolC